MKGLVGTILILLQKILYWILEYFFILVACITRFIKTRVFNWNLCRARKRLNQATSDLGKDIYTLHTQGVTNWHEDPGVIDKLKGVEEAESNLLATEQDTQKINKEYARKKEEIKEKYREKREAVDSASSAGD